MKMFKLILVSAIFGIMAAADGNAAGFLNVTNFGAKGDGVTDDTTAINNALTAVTAQGEEPLFPRGHLCLQYG